MSDSGARCAARRRRGRVQWIASPSIPGISSMRDRGGRSTTWATPPITCSIRRTTTRKSRRRLITAQAWLQQNPLLLAGYPRDFDRRTSGDVEYGVVAQAMKAPNSTCVAWQARLKSLTTCAHGPERGRWQNCRGTAPARPAAVFRRCGGYAPRAKRSVGQPPSTASKAGT